MACRARFTTLESVCPDMHQAAAFRLVALSNSGVDRLHKAIEAMQGVAEMLVPIDSPIDSPMTAQPPTSDKGER
jgi:hypothetical protein